MRSPKEKRGLASLRAPSAPSEGFAKFQVSVPGEPHPEFRLTSSGVASYRSLPPKRSLATSTPVRQPKPRFCFASPGLTEVKADRCSAALLGMTISCVPLCPPQSKPLEAASRIRKIISSGASSRLAPFPLPKEPPHCLPRRSDLWSPAASSFPCGLSDEAGTAVPITDAT